MPEVTIDNCIPQIIMIRTGRVRDSEFYSELKWYLETNYMGVPLPDMSKTIRHLVVEGITRFKEKNVAYRRKRSRPVAASPAKGQEAPTAEAREGSGSTDQG
jgi:hypothetical protein